jgi:hypothetical protein
MRSINLIKAELLEAVKPLVLAKDQPEVRVLLRVLALKAELAQEQLVMAEGLRIQQLQGEAQAYRRLGKEIMEGIPAISVKE